MHDVLLKCLRREPYKSKSDHFSLVIAPCPQWQHVVAGGSAELCGILGGVSGVSLKADPVTKIMRSLTHAVGDLHPLELCSPHPASFSGVLPEDSSLAAMEDSEVNPGAISDSLVYLM